MKFSFVTIHVRDFEKSLAFYHELLGLNLIRRSKTGDGELAFLGEEGVPNLELVYSPKNSGNTYTGFSIGIVVDSLEKGTELMEKNGHRLLRGPISPAPGTTFSYFAGPDDEEVQLVEFSS